MVAFLQRDVGQMLRTTNASSCFRVLPAAVLLACAGCSGSANQRVAGRIVRSDGAPLVGATVTARHEETGVSYYGTTDADGRYELSAVESGAGAPPGTYRVVIMEQRGDRDSIHRPTIAAKYSDPALSGLTLTVVAGEDAAFDVTVDPP